MKNNKIVIFLLSLIILWGCNQDDYADFTAPDEFSDVSWLLSLDRNRDPAYRYDINADTFISFLNLAQNAVSSEWKIEEGNFFLKEGFKSIDSLEKYIDTEAGLSITSGKAHVFFRKSGLNTVTLINKFNEPVKTNISSDNADRVKVETYDENGLFVVKTEFIFDVYATISPAFSVLKDGVEIIKITETDLPSIDDSDTWPTIEIEAATSLTFVDNTTIGRPNFRTWATPDGVPGTSNLASSVVKFYRLGTFNAGVFKSGRLTPFPQASTEKIIPLKIKVVKSSQPFVFDGALTEDINQKITFRVNGEVNPFTGAEGSFTVNVKNAATGFDQNIPVQSARVNASDAIFIDLTLSAPIYNSDVVTVSYNGAGNIRSADDRLLEAFGPAKVSMYFGVSILPGNSHPGFEIAGGNVTNAGATSEFFVPGGNGIGTGTGNGQYGDDWVWQRVDNKSRTGFASMRYKLPNVAAIPIVNLFGFFISDGPNGVPAGTYKVSYWVFIEPGTTLNAFRIEFGNPVTDTKIFDISSAEKGKWVEISNVITFPTTLTGNNRTTLRILADDNPGVSGAQLMYFDDLSLVPIEVRP